MTPGIEIVGAYDFRLVFLSVVVAVLASYVALDLAGRVTAARGIARHLWLHGGACAMGFGIWAMHYIGMLALKLPIPVYYDSPTVLVSLLAAISASGVALLIVSRKQMGFARAALGSLPMGGAIASMHYLGMAAMRMPAACRYSVWIVTASLALAVAVSFVALLLTFHFREGGSRVGKFGSALAMGAAISLMHYTGMAAATFTPATLDPASLSHAFSISTFGTVALLVATFALLGFALVLAVLDRRHAEKLFRTNELGPLLLESAPEAIIGIDAAGNCTFCNREFLRLTGHSAFEELKRKDMHQLTHHTRADGSPYPVAECPICQSLRTGEETHSDTEVFWRKDGTSFPVEYRSHPVERLGNMIGCVVTFTDITQRKQAEKQLRDSEAKHRVLFESSGDAHLIMDETGFLDCNSAALEMFGYTAKEQLLTLHPSEFSPPTQPSGASSRASADEKILATMQHGSQRFSWMHRRANGEIFPAEVYLTPLTLNGKPALLGTIRDMTQRQLAEDRLRESATRLGLAADAAHLGVWEHNFKTNVALWDRRMLELYGISDGEFQGTYDDWVKRVHPEDRSLAVAQLEQAIAKKASFRSEFRAVWPSGEIRFIEAYGTVLAGPSGELRSILGVSSDITERKQAAAAMLEAKEKAEAASRAKSDFLANISHEIRTPLNGVIGMTELALDTPLTAEQREYLETVKASADTLLSVVEDILDFSKIEAGKMGLDLSDFDVRCELEAALQKVAARAGDKKLVLSRDVAPEIPEMLHGDSGRLRQVLLSLVGNAIKFTAQGEIGVRVNLDSRDDHDFHLHFAVSDTGVGIPRDKIHSIFDAFSQADTSFTRKHGGTGLGLAISQRLVMMMGGRIWAESELGKGSVFHFTVRLKKAASKEIKPAAIAPPEPIHNAKVLAARESPQNKSESADALHVLVAEDNLINQRLIVRLLEKRGHRVTVAQNGREAVAAVARTEFDLVLMDVQMPEMDGLKATAAIRSAEEDTGAHQHIIALTAHAMKGDREKCIAAGMDGYITKPLQPKALEQILGNCKARRRASPIASVDAQTLQK